MQLYIAAQKRLISTARYRQKKKKGRLNKYLMIGIAMLALVGFAQAQTCDPGFYTLSGTCTICPAGYKCDGSGSKIACASTEFASRGSSVCTSCPAGYSCPGISGSNLEGTPVVCASGTYSPAGTTTCLSCPAGSYCPGIATASPSPCLSGYYSASGAMSCEPCPAGYKCTSTSASSKVACNSGEYSLGLASTCTQCPAGKQCPNKALPPVDCPNGFYSSAGASTCTICPAGSRCPAQDQAPIACLNGEYSQQGMQACHGCPQGYKCPTKNSAPVVCPIGTYSTSGSTACTSCNAGQQCPHISDATQISNCPAGHYSVAGSALCLECPAGYSCTSGTPVACGTGYYNLQGSSTACTQCPAGSFCPSATQSPIQCAQGYFSAAGATSCTRCTAGNTCTNFLTPQSCSFGYCPAGSQNVIQCPVGYDCSGGVTTLPTVCIDGKYRDALSSTCVTCPAGYKCEDRKAPVLIDSGFYSPQGNSKQLICPAGFACPDNVAPVACLAGQYSDVGDTVCHDCQIGYACPDKTNSENIIDCSRFGGLYANQARQTQCKICPAGSFCPIASPLPQPCDDGTYSLPGQIECTICPPGYECPSPLLPTMTRCPLGTFSLGRQKACTVCPAGYGCEPTQKYQCQANMISLHGDGFCRYLEANEISPTINPDDSVTFLACNDGEYKLYGMLVCATCPIGHYCPSKINPPIVCQPGYYQDQTGQTSCKLCSVGYYSIFGQSSCAICPAGFYCPDPTQVPKQCQLGTYSTAGSTACQPCTDGYICEFKEQTPNPTYSLCPAGFSCYHDPVNDFILTKVPSPAGFFQPTRGTGVMDSSAFIKCPQGFFCPKGTETPRSCPPGAYCPEQSETNTQYRCTPGMYIDFHFAGAENQDCQLCPEGTYCPQGAVVPLKCPVGYFCKQMAYSIDNINIGACPDGTYSGPFSLTDVSQCRTCPAGYTCQQTSTKSIFFKTGVSLVPESISVMPVPCNPGYYKSTTGTGACVKCPVKKPCPYYALTTYEIGLYCAPGHYCPLGTRFPDEFPCPAGTYSDSIDIIAASECSNCPAKFACSEGTNTLTRPKVPCAAGHYCPEKTEYPTQFECPAGTYSPATDNYVITQCIQCPPGSYCLAASVQPTGKCQAGYYCPAGSLSPTQRPCPDGTYLDYQGGKALAECRICSLGYYCPAVCTAPIKCPRGYYSDMGGLERMDESARSQSEIANNYHGCKPCPAGYYCPDEAMTQPLQCGTGYYSDAKAEVCLLCPFDNYCESETTTSADLKLCPNGYICNQGLGVKPYIPDHACPAGYWCQNSIKTECPTGTYNAIMAAPDATYCLTVPAGYYTDAPASSSYEQNLCHKGYYCEAGSQSGKAKLCPEGTFRSIPGGSSINDCGICPTGHYCSDQTMEPFVCPIGYYCPIGIQSPIPCPIGKFGASQGLREASECTPCYAGRYCSQKGLGKPDGECDPGFFCIQGAYTASPVDGVTGDVCPAGKYCTKGSKQPKNCPAGKYNPLPQKSAASDCIDCLAGQYCSGSNTANPAAPTGPCYAGFYCAAGSKVPNQNVAPAGTYAIAGSSLATNCPKGTYNPFVAQSACQTCPAGYLCPNLGMSTLNDCPTGQYCPAGSQTGTNCPAGTYNDQTNAKALTDCKPCSGGKYCAIAGLPAPTGDCNAGYFCTKSATSAGPSTLTANYGPCQKGYYCPKGSSLGIPCPPGKFNPNTLGTSIASCTTCTAGKYCQKEGLQAVEGSCTGGYYCASGTISPKPSLYYCRAGSKCATGSSTNTSVTNNKCPAGYYQNQDKRDACISCPKGYYCPQGTVDFTTNPCPFGYYCPSGSTSSTQYPCPVGTYNNFEKRTSVRDCIPCDPGKECHASLTNQIAPIGDCQAGQYCQLGAPRMITINGNTITNPTYTMACSAGYYCPAGSSFQIPCPAGKYCQGSGLTSPTGDCQAGYYCTGGSSTPTPLGVGGNACIVGHYCPAGTADPVPCPAGTLNTQLSRTDVSQCLPCTAGSYCSSSGLSAVSGACPAGFYCPGGQKSPFEFICPAGFKCPGSSTNKIACSGILEYQDQLGQSTCKTCPKGYQCTDSSITKCQPQLVETSFYCDGTQKTAKTCGPGFYNTIDGSEKSTDCKKCPPGYYCPNTLGVAKLKNCPAGSYCLEGSSTANLCPIGYYCPSGTNIPIPCKPGLYCGTPGLQEATTMCTQGYYCTYEIFTAAAGVTNAFICDSENTAISRQCKRGATTATQNDCPMGAFCPTGSETPTLCPIGTFSNVTRLSDIAQCTKCTPGKYCQHRGMTSEGVNCTAGYYCPPGVTTSTPTNYVCQEGYYCPAGVQAPIPCDKGFYQPYKLQSSCLSCPIGYMCDQTAMRAPTICPQGKYCGAGTITPSNCPIGTYSNFQGLKTAAECQKCDSGKYCSDPGLTSPSGFCNGGFYCDKTKLSGAIGFTTPSPVDYTCPIGSYCPDGSIAPLKCPPGKYSDATGLNDITGCKNCPAGYICPSYGISDTSQMVKCPAGYYCPLAGAASPLVLDEVNIRFCPEGYFCVEGSTEPAKCPIGTFNPSMGQSACQSCTAGFQCELDGSTAPQDCGPGYYCPYVATASGTNRKPCPAGTYSDKLNLKDSSECSPCPAGKYCLQGSSAPTGDCDEGSYCAGSSAISNPSTVEAQPYANPTKNMVCPLGHYCPSGTRKPIPCEAGKYASQTGKALCDSCPETTYVDTVSATVCTLKCDPGFHCIKGSSLSRPYDGKIGEICQKGYYCLNGAMTKCPPGKYQNVLGQDSCSICPQGYYCQQEGTIDPQICPEKYYCPEGTKDPVECPPGSYVGSGTTGLEGKHQCIPCKTGYYCQNSEFDQSKKCYAGYFCKSNAAEPNPSNMLCPAGFYCGNGTTLPSKCKNGTFSKEGAESEANCTACSAGYYCQDGGSKMMPCTLGNYCPAGAQLPTPCPLGTYGPKTMQISVLDCPVCPPGSLCNITGVIDPADFQCPPGHYCTRGILEPIQCPVGTYRAVVGGSSLSSCYDCNEGFYCPYNATIVPIACTNGTYCPKRSEAPIICPPGYYCPAKTGKPINCPPGFYCPGKSEFMYKCQNGTYCPEKSSYPIKCPGGTFGTGVAENANISVSCISCGRGMYSSEDAGPGLCFDCTPGYVCLGHTNSRTPTIKNVDNGYQCPPGHYCPKASYKETPCPIGTFNKHYGKGAMGDCINCIGGYYNDLVGQSGCKKCGPSSTSNEGSDTCTCIGRNRKFIKSIGSCLCESGFKAKDGQKDADSISDCESFVKPPCAEGQITSLNGDCVNSDKEICAKQCNSSDGTVIPGTGVCSCSKIVEADQVCDAACRQKQITTVLNTNGTITLYNPVTKQTTLYDPSNVPGFIGNFKCTTKGGSCQMYSVGKSDSGDFTYDYSPNPSLIAAATSNTQASNKTNPTKRRLLQAATQQSSSSTKITNPVMCVVQGSAVLFSVNSTTKQYPVYMKDSILNTNPDFDYGQFLQLQNSIEHGSTTVTAFSFVFDQPGVYVFQDSKDNSKVTIIGTVAENQECSNKDANVQSATASSLASIGIVPQSKNVQANWPFIIGTFVFLIIVSFGFVTLVIVLHYHNDAAGTSSTSKKNFIYYDKIHMIEKENAEKQSNWCKCLCRKKAVNKVIDHQIVPGEDLDISYDDLNKLLREFREQMEILKQKLKEDGEKHDAQAEQQDGQAPKVEEDDDETALVKELAELREFVNNNKECIEEFFNIKRGQEEAKDQKGMSSEEEEDQNEETPEQAEVRALLNSQQRAEEEAAKRMKEQLKKQEEELVNKINEQNDETKNSLLEEFRNRIGGQSNLTDQEKTALMDEMAERLDRMGNLLQSEQADQNKKLADILAARKKKKDDLKEKFVQVHENVEQKAAEFNDKLMKIADQEKAEIANIDKEIEQEREKGKQQIEEELQKRKNERLAEMEKKLEKLKKSGGTQGKDQLELGDMLHEYGKLVKQVEGELAQEKEKQDSELEERLRKRREQRKKEIEDKRKEREQNENAQLQDEHQQMQKDIDQIKQLIKPVTNEDKRIEALMNDEKIGKDLQGRAIIRPSTAEEDKSQAERQDAAHQKQLELIGEEEDVKIDKMVDQMRKQNERSLKDQEARKAAIKQQLEQATNMDKNEKRRLMNQFEELKNQIEEQQRREASDQDSKLEEALRKRRMRKQQVVQEQQATIQDKVLKDAERKTDKFIEANFGKEAVSGSSDQEDSSNVKVDEDQIKAAFNHLSEKFHNDEMVQVIENYLEQKNMKELKELMLALFEERAKGLRKYVFDLMGQKQTELELIREEFRPRFDLLKERKQKGLIGSEELYREQMAALSKEEADRKMDVEIAINELETKMEEELQVQAVQARAKAEEALKARQTKEKQIMLDMLMEHTHKDNDTVQKYLMKEKKDAEKELKRFKKAKLKEKEQKLKEIQAMREARDAELQEKESKMLNWEQRMKEEEEKQMAIFEKQKKAILAKKMAEQNNELLLQANKGAIDAMKAEHLAALQALETAIEREQSRQLEMMRAKMKDRNMSAEQEKIRRDLKMALVMKQKEKRQEQAKSASQTTGSGFGMAFKKDGDKEEELRTCIDKGRIMQIPLKSKKCYVTSNCTMVYNKKEYAKKIELERKFYGQKDEIFEIVNAAMKIEQSAATGSAQLQGLKLAKESSIEDSLEDSMSTFSNLQNLTFKELIDHVQLIENNYQMLQMYIQPPGQQQQ